MRCLSTLTVLASFGLFRRLFSKRKETKLKNLKVLFSPFSIFFTALTPEDPYKKMDSLSLDFSTRPLIPPRWFLRSPWPLSPQPTNLKNTPHFQKKKKNCDARGNRRWGFQPPTYKSEESTVFPKEKTKNCDTRGNRRWGFQQNLQIWRIHHISKRKDQNLWHERESPTNLKNPPYFQKKRQKSVKRREPKVVYYESIKRELQIKPI